MEFRTSRRRGTPHEADGAGWRARAHHWAVGDLDPSPGVGDAAGSLNLGRRGGLLALGAALGGGRDGRDDERVAGEEGGDAVEVVLHLLDGLVAVLEALLRLLLGEEGLEEADDVLLAEVGRELGDVVDHLLRVATLLADLAEGVDIAAVRASAPLAEHLVGGLGVGELALQGLRPGAGRLLLEELAELAEEAAEVDDQVGGLHGLGLALGAGAADLALLDHEHAELGLPVEDGVGAVLEGGVGRERDVPLAVDLDLEGAVAHLGAILTCFQCSAWCPGSPGR